MNNPLTGGGKKATFENGTYVGTLMHFTSVERMFEGEDAPKMMLNWVFDLDDVLDSEGNPAQLTHSTSTSIYWGGKYPMSGLIKLLTTAAPKIFNKAECDGNRDRIWERMSGLKGKKFNLTCAANEKGYMKLVAAQLLSDKVGKIVEAAKAPSKPVAAPVDDIDDIPF